MFSPPFRLAYLSTYFILSAVSGSLVLTPPRLVLEYGAPASANCSTDIIPKMMGWEASQGSVDPTSGVQQLTWTVKSITEWDIKPLCFIIVDDPRFQQKTFLPVTIYKIPDKVSISLLNDTRLIIEGEIYWLQCDIQNVAPVQNVIVNWYKEQTLLKRDNVTSEENTKEPQNKTSKLQIRPNRTDDGAQYRCEAELELGAEGLQPPPRPAEPLIISVAYMPQFQNHTEILLDSGEMITLNCTVKANPPAVYNWIPAHLKPRPVITSSSLGLGNYTCTASNQYGNDTKVFTIRKKGSRVVFWSILGSCLVLLLGLIAGYVGYVWLKISSNSVI